MAHPFEIDAEHGTAEYCSERLRLMSLLITIVAIAIAAVFGPAFGIRWSTAGSGAAQISIVVLIGAGLRLRHLGGAKRLATLSEVMGVMIAGTIAGGAVAMVALRSGAPMADGTLESADALLGLSAQSVVEWVAASGIPGEAMRVIYNSAFPEVAASVVLLSFLGRGCEVWRLCFLFLATLLTCALISFAIPAYGSFVHAAPETIEALPPGAGTFWWAALNRCRSADLAVLGINDLGGVIAFPSFHAIIVLLTIQAWSWNRIARVPLIVWNGAVLFTTLPIGGHYFVDLFAGALVWLAWSALADRMAKGGSPSPRHRPALAA